MTYGEFLAAKTRLAGAAGFVRDEPLHPDLFPFQRHIVTRALRNGRFAIFSECGTGKTFMQLAWADACARETGLPSLILTPLAVANQTVEEARRFGYVAQRVKCADDVSDGINVANYDRLDAIDCSAFGAVVLDESSILKNFTGATKNKLVAAFAHTRYRLCCTATPAPNDHKELGNHSEFLGLMESSRMLSRWFVNDTMKAGGYRLKGHAERDFWRWVGSWAVAIDKPSDIGFSDEGYILPELTIHNHIVQADISINAGDQLFRIADVSATGLHREMRLTAEARAGRLAELVAKSEDPWVLWCNTDYEASEIVSKVPDVIEVKGPESVEAKERKLLGFTKGEFGRILTKPSIAGFGLNWQHCRQMAFVGLSYSYEQMYQAIRRSYRYGQVKPVSIHIISADTEGPVLQAVLRKEADHKKMKAALVAAMKEFSYAS